MAKRSPWTKEEVIAAIQRWAAEHGGQPPASTDFHPGDCRRSARISAARSAAWMARAEFTEGGDYPWPRTVARMFGSWNKAIREAGFIPRRESVPDEELSRSKPSIAKINEQLELAKACSGNERRKHLFRVAEMALAAAEQ